LSVDGCPRDRRFPVRIGGQALGLRLAELAVTESGGPMPVSAAEQLRSRLPDMVRRELQHRGLLTDEASVAMRLIAWIQVS